MGLFDGKVAAITGAGGGLGRAYALAFAREGAKVVVNDLGSARDGSGAGSAMADQVVAEIVAMGGQAAANYASVATRQGAESIVKTAVDAFGRLDVLVNNAGILRDKTLVKMTDDQWEIVLAVHLTGTYLCTQAAAVQMLQQGTPGRIINTSSLAGLKGNFGQANYGSAKAGIAGFTRVTALELGRKGITVNCIAPLAKTRLTDDVSAIPDEARPELVAPMVLFLASDLAADINGRIFGVHGNHLFEYHMELTRGVDKGAEPWTPQEIKERLADITRIEAEHVKKEMAARVAAGPAPAPVAVDPATRAQKVFEAMATAIRPDKVSGWNAKLHFDIADVGQLTVTIAGGNMTAAQGFVDSPTCLVKMDGDTFFGMAQGKVDGNQAFMQGKITATNLGDLMKYSTAFDQKKARAAVAEALAALEAAAAQGAPAAPVAVDPLTKAVAVFEAMATAIRPDKVSGWNATMHFDIAEVGQVTLSIRDGAMAVAKGFEGDATCLVKMDGDTFFGMTQGKVDGNQAFMQGKITATNLGDLMKYSTAFDQKKARAIVAEALAGIEAGAAQAAPAPAARVPVDPLTQAIAVFEAMATALVPNNVAGWDATMHFDIAGVGQVTFAIKEGIISIARRFEGEPTCLVKMEGDTFFGMSQGKVDSNQAFLAGKITATKMGDLIKYSRAFDQEKARAAVAEALARLEGGVAPGSAAASAKAGPPEPVKPSGLNQACMGKLYSLPPFFVKADQTQAYARATNDDNPRYFDTLRPGGIIAPPLFAVRLFHDLQEACLLDPELNADLMMLLFGEQDLHFYAPLRPTDLLERSARITHMEAKESGEVFDLNQRLVREGKLVCEATSRFFIRSRGRKKEKTGQPEAEIESLPPFAFTSDMTVRADQTRDYADASGDHNPIHLDDNMAKAAGMGGIILHGLCTMAFASQGFVKKACGDDPTRLVRLKVRFRRPVRPGDTVTTQAWLADQGEKLSTYGFRMVNQEGVVVVSNGLAIVKTTV
ncbi:MAG: SDR family NAD(P)-dependent oxidoreductase [Bradymonadales bacterium]|nr:SDR family NAD(P)-dependent oxidoreductase [Bradymonadales bacterium]